MRMLIALVCGLLLQTPVQIRDALRILTAEQQTENARTASNDSRMYLFLDSVQTLSDISVVGRYYVAGWAFHCDLPGEGPTAAPVPQVKVDGVPVEGVLSRRDRMDVQNAFPGCANVPLASGFVVQIDIPAWSPLPSPVWTGGQHTFSVRVKDAAGRYSESVTKPAPWYWFAGAGI